MFIELDTPKVPASSDEAILERTFSDSLSRVLGARREMVNLEFYELSCGIGQFPVHVVRLHTPPLEDESRELMVLELAAACQICERRGVSRPVLVSLEEVPPENGYEVPLREVKMRW